MNCSQTRNFVSDLPLTWKFSIVILVVTTLLGASLYFLINSANVKILIREHDNKGQAIARNLAINAEEYLLINNLVRLQLLFSNMVKSEEDIIYSFLADQSGNILTHTFSGGFPTDLKNLNIPSQKDSISSQMVETEVGSVNDIAVSVLKGDAGYVHIGLSHERIRHKIGEIRRKIVLTCFLVTSAALLLSFFLSRRLINPLSSLALGAHKIGKGDFTYRVAVRGQDEIGSLASTFNRMAQQLHQDLARRVEAEHSLLESERLYRTLVDHVDMRVTLVDEKFRIIKTNAPSSGRFKVYEDLVNERRCYEVFKNRNSPCVDCPGVHALTSCNSHEVDVEENDGDGMTFVKRIRAFPIIDSEDQCHSFIEVVEDVTDRIKMEEELQNKKRIESIGQLAGGIAHDFNNLLSCIYGNISLARQFFADKGKLSEKITEAENATIRAQYLAKQLLTFSKGGAPVLQPTNLGEIIKESVSFLLSGSSIHCEFAVDENLMAAEADNSQISQVFFNLIVNARQAMVEGGTVELAAKNIELEKNNNLAMAPGKYVKIDFKDHGPGIEKEHLEKIFVPYFTTKSDGQGLGLAICYSIIRKHKGLITVNSVKGEGTTFSIYVPASEYKVADVEEQSELVCGVGKILIMDDEEPIRMMIEEMVKDLGYSAEHARDGEEAIDLYRKAKEAGQGFDVVIMDLTIQGGMGGKEAIAQLKEYDPGVKAIVSSGYSNDPIMSQYEKYGFCGVVKKPFKMVLLSQELKKAVLME